MTSDLIPIDSANTAIEEFKRRNVKLFGFEGFAAKENGYMPLLNCVADFSMGAERNYFDYDGALKLIKEMQTENKELTHVEFVIEE